MRFLLLATVAIFASASAVSAGSIETGMDANQLGLPTSLQFEEPRQSIFISGYQGMTAEVERGYQHLEDSGLDMKQLGLPSTVTRG